MMGATSEMPLVRRVGNAIFATLLTLVARRRVSDSASGMRVFREGRAPSLDPLPDGLNFTPVMSVRALYEGSASSRRRSRTRAGRPVEAQRRQGRAPLPALDRVDGGALQPARHLRRRRPRDCSSSPACSACRPCSSTSSHRSVPEDQIYRLFTVLIIATAGINVLVFALMSGAIFRLVPTVRTTAPPLPKRVQLGRVGGSGTSRRGRRAR